jgi:hypothetical protein
MIKRRLLSALPKEYLLFAQDYYWNKCRLLRHKIKDLSRAGETVDPLLIPPPIPEVPFDRRNRRKKISLRVMTDTERSSMAEKVARRAKRLKSKKRKFSEQPVEEESNEIDEEKLMEQKRRRRLMMRLQRGVLRRVRNQSVSPPVVPVLESKIIPLLEKSNLMNNPVIAFRVALVYKLRPLDRKGDAIYADVLRSISGMLPCFRNICNSPAHSPPVYLSSATTKTSTVNFLLLALVRDWKPKWTMAIIDRLKELNYKGDGITEALVLSALSQYQSDQVAFTRLRELVQKSNDQTSRLALLKAAICSADVRTALETITRTHSTRTSLLQIRLTLLLVRVLI